MLPHESTSSSFSSSSFLPSSSSCAEITEPEPVIKIEDEIQFNSTDEDEFEVDVQVKVEEELDKEKEENVFQHLSQLLNEPDDDRPNKNGTVCDPQNVEMMFELKEEEEAEEMWVYENGHNILIRNPNPRESDSTLYDTESGKLAEGNKNNNKNNRKNSNSASDVDGKLKRVEDCYKNNLFNCPYCPRKIAREDNFQAHLKAHLRTHKSTKSSSSSPSKKIRFPCHLCSVTTSRKSNLKKHMLNVHSSPFKCPESGCDYKAKKTRKNDIRLHLEDRHFKSLQETETILNDIDFSSEQKLEELQHLQPGSSSSQNLVTTTKIIPSNSTSTNFTNPILVSTQSNCANFPDQQKMFYKVYKCGYCDYKTNHEYHLKAHLRTHKSSPSPTKKITFSCNLCSLTTSRKSNLKKHMLNVHAETRLFKCTESGCEYSTNHKSSLKFHGFSRHGKREKDLEIFTCSLCPYKTADKKSLRYHVNTVHVRLFKFKCDLCPYKTPRKGDFQRHVNCVHLNLRPYKCPETGCDYVAKESVAFKQHMRRSHRKSQEEIKDIWKTASSNYNNSSAVQIQIQPECKPELKLSIKATSKIPVCSQNVETKVESNLKSKVKSCKVVTVILYQYHCNNCEFYTQEQKELAVHLYNQHNLPKVQLQRLN